MPEVTSTFQVGSEVVITESQYNVKEGTSGIIEDIIVKGEVYDVKFDTVKMCVQSKKLCLADEFDFAANKVYEEPKRTREETISIKVLNLKGVTAKLKQLDLTGEQLKLKIQELKEERKRLQGVEKAVSTGIKKLSRIKGLTDAAIITQLVETIKVW